MDAINVFFVPLQNFRAIQKPDQTPIRESIAAQYSSSARQLPKGICFGGIEVKVLDRHDQSNV